jgi:hypothetical protein
MNQTKHSVHPCNNHIHTCHINNNPRGLFNRLLFCQQSENDLAITAAAVHHVQRPLALFIAQRQITAHLLPQETPHDFL